MENRILQITLVALWKAMANFDKTPLSTSTSYNGNGEWEENSYRGPFFSEQNLRLGSYSILQGNEPTRISQTFIFIQILDTNALIYKGQKVMSLCF